MESKLAAAFRWHMRNERPAFYYAQGYNGRNAWPEKATGVAVEALRRARADVAAGKTRYPAPIRGDSGVTWQPGKPGFAYAERPESVGLRLVGRVEAECGGRNGYWAKRETCGWYTDPHGDSCRDGTGLCWGVVYQLAGRKGHARFVAGYQFGGVDGGPTLDLSNVIHEYVKGDAWNNVEDSAGAQNAARAADDMAKAAAEKEREYQTAWRAGSIWSDEKDEVETTRKEIRAILAERRTLKGQSGYPALCSAIAARVSDLLDDVQTNRKNMRDLAEGNYRNLYFWAGDKRLQDAFCNGAEIDAFPA